LKSVIDIPYLSWRHKRRAKKDKGGYPPRITLTVTYKDSIKDPKICELGIQGISGGLKAFNIQIPPIAGGTSGIIIRSLFIIIMSYSCMQVMIADSG
jgi:hypothetical protein